MLPPLLTEGWSTDTLCFFLRTLLLKKTCLLFFWFCRDFFGWLCFLFFIFSSFNFELVTIIISTILLLCMFLFFLSCLASICVLCHTSPAIFSDRKPPSCAIQNWGFDHREINPLVMGYSVLFVLPYLVTWSRSCTKLQPSELRIHINSWNYLSAFQLPDP